MLALFMTLAATMPAAASTLPPVEVRAMIRDARAIIAANGDQLWPGFAHGPFELDLVEHDREVLFCRTPAAGFTPLGRDPVTGCSMQERPRQEPEDVAASEGLFADGLTIVIGLPATLAMSRERWTATVMHEAFHQYQTTIPGYQAAIDRLGLAQGNTNGMWMLDYPFPYGNPAVGAAFAAMNISAAAYLAASSPVAARQAIGQYVRDRQAAQAAVSPAEWRYVEFQIGQEGIARWTELQLEAAGGRTDPAMAADAADRRGLAVSLRSITTQGLATWKRSAFYVYGDVEGKMLEAMHRPWRVAYRLSPFAIGDQLAQAVGQSH